MKPRPSMDHLDELTVDSRVLALRKLLEQPGDPEIKPPRVIWATSDGREKLPRRRPLEPRLVPIWRSA